MNAAERHYTPLKTITKFLLFVIFGAIIVSSLGCGASSADSYEPDNIENSVYAAPEIAGKITAKEIRESSGLAASQCQQNVLWTQNDSGDGAYIYAIDTSAKLLGVWRVAGATNTDWEGIALRKEPDGTCRIYIGEIGNNRLARETGAVYRIPEPNAADGKGSTKRDPKQTEKAEKLTFSYPDSRQNAEALMVHPQTGDIYVISKVLLGAAGVYKIKPVFDEAETQTATRVGELSLPAVPNGLVTSGDISPDGGRVIISDYFAGYELTLPHTAKGFDDIWTVLPVRVDIGKREIGEGVAYSADGNAIFSTSEKANSPLYIMRRNLK